MGLEWVVSYCWLCCFVGWIISYCLDLIALTYIIGWIIWIGFDRIVLYRLDEDTLAFMHWQVTARMGRMGRMEWIRRWWDRGGTDGR